MFSVAARCAFAEHKTLLRTGRAKEALPLITLPQSLLLQDSNSDGDHRAADGEAKKSIEAAASHGGYGQQLWSSVQESAEEVVDDAREAFFASQIQNAAAATTTATTTTTQDPAILAKQLQLTKDNAQAQKLLLDMIKNAQMEMLKRLQAVGYDLEATDQRAKEDLKALQHSAEAAKDLPMFSNNAEAAVVRVQNQADNLQVGLKDLGKRAHDDNVLMADLVRLKKEEADPNLKIAKNLPSGKKRIDENAQTMNVLVPRLTGLIMKMTRIEAGLWDGNLTEMVRDTVTREVLNTMEDAPRGFGRFLPNEAMF